MPLSGTLPLLTDGNTVCMKTPNYARRGSFSENQYQPGDQCTWFIQVSVRVILVTAIVVMHTVVVAAEASM